MLNPIVYAVPIFMGLLLLEALFGHWMRRQTFALGDTITSISLGLSGQIVNVFTKAWAVGVYALVYAHLSFTQLPADRWWTWALAILGYDFLYYWDHRLGHEVGVLWAAHVVHHSSEEYNYATALRQSSTGFLTGWLFFWPLAVMGVPPKLFVMGAAISLLYQFWVHTRHIGRLGWFDRCFASPSNHRVHHGSNEYCIDRNYGGILMLWDHLFGTFTDERPPAEEPIVYGTIGQLASFSPLRANFHKYQDLWAESQKIPRWRDRWLPWVKSPGWHFGEDPATQIQTTDEHLYRPIISSQAALFACLQAVFLLLLGGLFVTFPARLDMPVRMVLGAWTLVSLWVMSGTLENRVDHRRWQALWLLSLLLPLGLARDLPAPWTEWISASVVAVGAFLVILLLRIPQQRLDTVRA